MLSGEMPPTSADLHFTLFGFPVRVHPMFWLVAAILGMRSADLISILIWVVALFISILVHELGHAFAMRWYGYSPSITLYAMGGYAAFGPRAKTRTPGFFGRLLISFAGPLAGFLLAALIVLILIAAQIKVGYILLNDFFPMPALKESINPQINTLIHHLFFICTLWGVVNLLPIFPLDGGQISREICMRFDHRDGIRTSLSVSVAAAAGMALVGMIVWKSLFITLMFAYLGYMSFTSLQRHRGPW